MSSSPPQHDKDEPDRLGRELRSLPRMQAPWDFEARLRQRIWGVRKPDVRHGFFRLPAPRYALPALAVVVLGVVGYLEFGGRPGVAPVLQQQDQSVSPSGSTPRRIPPRTPESVRGFPLPTQERPTSGPSSSDAAVRVSATPSRIRDSAVVSGLRRRLADTLSPAASPADSARKRRPR